MRRFTSTARLVHQWFKRVLDARPAQGQWDAAAYLHWIFVSAIFGGLFALIEPSHATGLVPLASLLFWLGHSLAGFAVMFALHRVLVSAGIWRARLASWFGGTVAIVLVGGVLERAFPVTVIGDQTADDFWLEAMDDFWVVAPQVAVIWFLYLLAVRLRTITIAREEIIPPASPPKETPAYRALIARLPPEIGTEIISAASEQHYLRITTPLGSALVLGKLTDLKDAYDPLEAGLIHRSHFVCYRFVDRITGGTAIMQDGRSIPISRRRQSEVAGALRAFKDYQIKLQERLAKSTVSQQT